MTASIRADEGFIGELFDLLEKAGELLVGLPSR